MKPTTSDVILSDLEQELSARVEAFEVARAAASTASVAEHLPAPDHPYFSQIAVELLRVDLELAWQAGEPRRVEQYMAQFVWLGEPAQLAPLAFEEYRLRCQAGERVAPSEYADRLGVETSSWPNITPASVPSPSWVDHCQRRKAAQPSFPAPGDTQHGFRFIAEIGRGSFSRVYLAQQDSLANRLVVLKVSAQRWMESDLLARLQHTNIVPIYSVHRDQDQQLVCMPFFGCCTLADVLHKLFGATTGPSVLPRSGAALLSTVADRAAETTTVVPSPSPLDPLPLPAPAMTLHNSWERLRACSYVEACLWLLSEMTAGLAHAHQLGIVHRDLKPANVLITDDGRPMLLDFNLSADAHHPEEHADQIGGTLPYMSPEHLRGLLGQAVPDARSDLYALGVIGYELLTGKRPFPDRQGNLDALVVTMVADRQQEAVEQALASVPADVPRAVVAMLARCLAADPAERYGAADQLQEDLQRQLQHLPLRYARDRVWRERLAKWSRRHPRLASGSTVLMAALLMLGALGGVLWMREEAAAQLQAEWKWRGLSDDLDQVRIALRQPEVQPDQLEAGLTQSLRRFRHYLPATSDTLASVADFQRLPPDQQLVARQQLAEAAYLIARAEELRARQMMPLSVNSTEPPRTSEHSEAWIQRAEQLGGAAWSGVLAENELPAAMPSTLTAQNPIPAAASPSDTAAEAFPSSSFWPAYSQGLVLLDEGRFDAAVAKFAQAVSLEPKDYAAWFALGNAQAGADRFGEAIASFTACMALRPADWVVYYHRGLCQYRLENYAAAEADWDLGLRRAPHEPALRLNRALARIALNRLPEAEADLTEVLASPQPLTRAYFLRANVRDKLQRQEEAAADREMGLATPPADELSYLARAAALIVDDPAAAERDLLAALRLRPSSVTALRNLAHLYSESLGRVPEAIVCLDRALTLRPGSAELLASRAVLQGRLGHVDEAVRDAQAAWSLAPTARTAIHAACALALVSDSRPAARQQAIAWIQFGLKQEPQWAAVVARDPDLVALQGDPQVQTSLNAARTLLAPGVSSLSLP